MLSSLKGGSGLFFTLSNGHLKDGEKVFDVLQYKNPRAFSKDTRTYIDLVSIQEGVNPVGSAKFKIAQYPGDIDLMEIVEYCCTLDDATKKIAEEMQKIARNIKKTPLVYLGDFKAGLDNRYSELQEVIGELDEYGDVVNHNRDKFKKLIKKYREKKLITKEDFKIMTKLFTEDINGTQWTQLYKYCRDFWVIRWSIDELINGEKQIGIKIAKKIKMTLKEALRYKTICKLDLWAPVDDHYTEITNFFLTNYMDGDGESIAIAPTLTGYLSRIVGDIKHYGDPILESYNPMKMAKRMWAIGVSINDQKTLNKIYPLFASGPSILYQIDAEIETLIAILEDNTIEKEIYRDGAIDLMKKQIDHFKMRISLIYDIPIKEDVFFTIIDDIVNTYEETYFVIKKLNELSVQLTKVVSRYTEKYLESVGMLNKDHYDYLLKD
jgi:hypothetical protein